MPYIKQEKRTMILSHIEAASDNIKNGGDLNYCFSMLCKHFIDDNGESYSNYAECIAALEGAKLELYRRKVAPYEEQKIKENGDVF